MKSLCVNNEAILQAQARYKESYKKFEKDMKCGHVDQLFVNRKMAENGYNGHFFAIRYPDYDNAYVVFEHYPPTDPILYGQIKLAESDRDKKFLLGQLPNYWLMIDDLPEGMEEPSQETVSKYVQQFYEYWFDMNRIDEVKIQELLTAKPQESEDVSNS